MKSLTSIYDPSHLSVPAELAGTIPDPTVGAVPEPAVGATSPALAFKAEQIAASKTLRRDLDVQLQILKALLSSRERSLSITKLQEAIMWLGMDLKEISAWKNPYPNSYDPSNSVVDKTADGLKL